MPNSPDVASLFRSFQHILQELDRDVMQLLAQQDQKLQLDRRILTHYAQRLHRNASYHQQRLSDFKLNASERLQILLQQSLIEAQSKIWLAQSTLRLDALQNSYLLLENKLV